LNFAARAPFPSLIEEFNNFRRVQFPAGPESSHKEQSKESMLLAYARKNCRDLALARATKNIEIIEIAPPVTKRPEPMTPFNTVLA
jgi:hypothetical protein